MVKKLLYSVELMIRLSIVAKKAKGVNVFEWCGKTGALSVLQPLTSPKEPPTLASRQATKACQTPWQNRTKHAKCLEG